MTLRDSRDPEKLGDIYLRLRAAGVPIDIAVRTGVDNYNPAPANYSHEYQSELRERAASGDKYAISLLSGERIDDGD